MINEISVRTDKGEYNPGESISGVVYVRIVRPTCGTGIKVKIHGYEKFEYEYMSEADEGKSYKAHKDYINHDVDLYKTQGDEPLNMGNGLYPFRITLPSETPGTFYASNETEVVKWKAVVEYTLEVQVINEPRLSTVVPIIVQQLPQRSVNTTAPPSSYCAHYHRTRLLVFTDEISKCINVVVIQPVNCTCPPGTSPRAEHIAYPVRFLLVFKRNVHITARLHSHIHRTGDVLLLRVIITNNSSLLVHSLNIQLLRSVTLMCKQYEIATSRRDSNIAAVDDRVFITVEDECRVGHTLLLDMTRYQKGLDTIHIPLKSINSSPVIPCVRGLCIKCEYKVRLQFVLSNGGEFDLEVPVSVIMADKNKQWREWLPPPWLASDSAQVHHSQSILGVPENVLCREAFSKIPGFQPLCSQPISDASQS